MLSVATGLDSAHETWGLLRAPSIRDPLPIDQQTMHLMIVNSNSPIIRCNDCGKEQVMCSKKYAV